MKISIILVGASAAIASSQATFPNGFPECGQVCINNMLNQADNFGCGVDPVCLCTKTDFLYGIRDCSNEYCQDPTLASQVINYGSQYCADAGVAISGISGNTASATVPASTTVLATATTTGPFTGGATGSEAASSGVPITTSGIVTVITSGDSVITSTIGSTTILSTPEPPATSSGAEGGAGGVIVSTITSGDQVITTTISSAPESGLSTVVSSTVPAVSSDVVVTTTNSAGETGITTSATTVPSSEGGETTSEGEAPSSTGEGEGGDSGAQQTAAPLGIVAAAGLAALLL